MRTNTLIVLTGGLLWAALPAGRAVDPPSPEPPADVACRLDSGSGTLTPSAGPKGPLVRITGPGFTGNATITFKSVAPSRLRVRFASIRGMQTFSVGDGKHTFQGHLGWAGGRTVTYWEKTGRSVSNPALADVTMVMELTKAGDVDVSLSSRSVELGKELKINWVQQDIRARRGK